MALNEVCVNCVTDAIMMSHVEQSNIRPSDGQLRYIQKGNKVNGNRVISVPGIPAIL